MDRASSVEVRVRTGQETAENTARKIRMKWCGHIARMNKERWPCIVYNWKPTGKQNDLLDAQSNGGWTI